MRQTLIWSLILIVGIILMFLVNEIVAGRYFNAIALFSVASVFAWFALYRREPPDGPP